MNKKKQANYSLNTVNINYKARGKSNPSNTPDHSQSNLDSFAPEDGRDLKTLEQPAKGGELEVQFSDSKLKQRGKSQTMKESQFNRMRIHIHRKDKQQKWSHLRIHQSTIEKALLDSIEEASQGNEGRGKDLKTVQVRRRLVDPSLNQVSKKATSNDQRKNARNTSSAQEAVRQSPKMVSLRQKPRQPQNSPFVPSKLDNLLKEIMLKHDKVPRALPPHKESKKASATAQDTSNIRRRLAKLQMNRLVMPFRFRQPVQSKKKPQPQQPIQQTKNDFKQWDHIDIFNSKHGIQQYTQKQEQSLEESPEDIKQQKEAREPKSPPLLRRRSQSSKKKRYRRGTPERQCK